MSKKCICNEKIECLSQPQVESMFHTLSTDDFVALFFVALTATFFLPVLVLPLSKFDVLFFFEVNAASLAATCDPTRHILAKASSACSNVYLPLVLSLSAFSLSFHGEVSSVSIKFIVQQCLSSRFLGRKI